MRKRDAFLVLFVLVRCAMPAQDHSPVYDLGYGDGCASAAAQGPGVPKDPRRNEELYAKEPDYRTGWASGNAQCRVQTPNRL
jgi:hypothetical protein